MTDDDEGFMTDDDEEEALDPACPFCASSDHCDHLLLFVDSTFKRAEGGDLYEEFNDRWRHVLDQVDPEEPDFYESDYFRVLLEEADTLADDYRESDVEGGPGMSSAAIAYYCSSKERVSLAVSAFRKTSKEAGVVARQECHSTSDWKESASSSDHDSLDLDTDEEFEKLPSCDRIQNGDLSSRPVLIIVTEWPSGTMAIKFGSACRTALGLHDGEWTLVQMEPERIFRAVTDVSESEFRSALGDHDVSCPGSLIFIELQDSSRT